MVMHTARKSTRGRLPPSLVSNVAPGKVRSSPVPKSQATAVKQSRYATRKAITACTDLTLSRTISTHNILAIPGSGDHNLRYNLPFRFLDLPPELRNRIYDYIFNPTPGSSGLGVIKINGVGNYNNGQTSDRGSLAVLSVCREIYNEVRDLPFAKNYISLFHAGNLPSFIGEASHHQISAIQHVEIHLRYDDHDSHLRGLLKTLPNLTSLRLFNASFNRRNFLQHPNSPIERVMKTLRGLKAFEVVLNKDIWDERSEHQLGEDQAREDAKRLEAMWKPIVMQPKPAFG